MVAPVRNEQRFFFRGKQAPQKRKKKRKKRTTRQRAAPLSISSAVEESLFSHVAFSQGKKGDKQTSKKKQKKKKNFVPSSYLSFVHRSSTVRRERISARRSAARVNDRRIIHENFFVRTIDLLFVYERLAVTRIRFLNSIEESNPMDLKFWT